MKIDILFVCYGGGHAPIIRLIAERLILNNYQSFAILPLNGAVNFFNDDLFNGKVLNLSNFHILFDKNITEIFNYGTRILEENFNSNIGISKFESVFYLGLSFFDLVKEYGYDSALKKYKFKKRQSFLPKNTMLKILDFLNPKLIVTTNSPRFEYASILAARELKIPSLQILDLFGDDYPVPSADHIVVMNELVKNKLVRNGNNTSTFYAFGQPVLDYTIEKVKSYDKVSLKRDNNLDFSKILLFSPTRNFIYNDDLSIKEEVDSRVLNESIFSLLFDVSVALNIQVLVKIHPSDNISNYISYIEKYPRFYFLPKLDVYESLAISDYFLSYNSTMCVQALVCGKLSFTFNQVPGSNYPWYEFSEKPFIYSSDYIQLKNNLLYYINENHEVNFENFFQTGSLNKILNLVNSIIEE